MKNLNCFDRELLAKLQDLTKEKVEVNKSDVMYSVHFPTKECENQGEVKDLVKKMMEGRLIRTINLEKGIIFEILYSSKEHESLECYSYFKPQIKFGEEYERKKSSFFALELSKKNIDKIIEFTGGGVLGVKKELTYSFPNEMGVFLDAKEGDFIVFDKSKESFSIINKVSFNNKYQKKKLTCSDCKNYKNGFCVVFNSEQRVGKRCTSFKLK